MKEFIKVFPLSKEDHYLNSFSEMMTDVFIASDLKGTILYVSKNFFELFAYDPADRNLKLNLKNLIDKEDKERFKSDMIKIAGGGKISDTHYAGITSAKLKINININQQLKDDKKGKERILTVISDLTSQKDAEQKLVHSRRRFRLITESTTDVIWMMNLEMKETYISPSIVLLTGYAVGEYKKLPFSKRYAESSAALFKETISSQINDILKTNAYTPEYSKTFEVEYICKNVTTIWTEVKTSILYDEKDVLFGIIGVTRDITERKQAEKSLRESEKNFRQLTENINDAFWLSSLEKNIYINPASEEIWGCKTAVMYETPNMNLLFIHPEDILRINDVLNSDIYKKEKVFNEQYRIINPDGNVRWIWVRNFPIYDTNGNIYRIGGIATDITEQLANEELSKNIEIAKRTTKIKQQFLANMSHEIRTPMTGVMGMIDLLLTTRLDQQQLEFTNTIKSSAEGLLGILNDILLLSKIEAGKLELHPSNFCPAEMLNQIKKLFEPLTKPKNISLLIETDEEIPGFIHADLIRVKQIISNFISNAIKFTDYGSITIRFSVIQKIDSYLKFKLEVIDTGIGVGKDNQQKLFSVFSQVDSTFSRNIEGVGLGLTISKELANLMGGEIGLISNTGDGSNFWFTFLAEEVERSSTVETEKPLVDYKNLKLNLKILLVEDTVVNQKVIKMMLENAGCEVDIAGNGMLAIEMFKENTYQIILMDILMPVMDGVETVTFLRKKYKNLPVIIGLSANAMEGDAEKYINLGMDDYLTKPIFANMLYDKMLKWADTKTPLLSEK
jgi:PAS domain S-box-containing protein